MRKYKEIGFIGVEIHETTEKCRIFEVEFPGGAKKLIKDELLYKKFPELRDKKITRNCYLYFLN